MAAGPQLDERHLEVLLHGLADAAGKPAPEELRRMALVAVSLPEGRLVSTRRHVLRSHRRLVMAMTATFLLMGTLVAGAYVVLSDDPSAPPGLQAALTSLFPPDQCVTAEHATLGVTDKLRALGYSDWTVTARPGAENQRCVVPGLLTGERQVILLPVEHPDVAASMQAVRQRLLSGCLDESHARDLIGSVLMALGVIDWSIETNGPVSYPSAELEKVREHIASGCAVISGSGHDAKGAVVYYISGG